MFCDIITIIITIYLVGIFKEVRFFMKLKRLLCGILAAATVFSMGAIGVSANNWTDSDFNFNLNYYDQTRWRPKDDTSKSYMKCYDSPSTFTSNNKLDVNVDVSNGNVYYFGAGLYKYMTNYVREWGYTQASIRAYPYDGQNNYSAHGVWSPDNKNGY